MKRLKYFLMLSILLLCFGFILSSEVHAQGDGPKEFEVNDVLPATTQLKISWDSKLNSYLSLDWEYMIRLNDNTNLIVVGNYMLDDRNVVLRINMVFIYENGWNSPYTDYSGGHNYIIIDTSSWSESKRTIKTITSSLDCFYWEDLNASPPGPETFDVGDVLPAGYIKISWDYNGLSFGYTDKSARIEGTNGFIINILYEYPELTLQTIVMGDSFDIGVGNTTIKLDTSSVITEFMSEIENMQEHIFWEVVTVDEYALGYDDAREKFGYYDPITQRWLSVEEYLDLYGYEKMGQTDFYNNFDKYFIPAMIIVFGGAIVLTILKVFNKRE